MALTYASNYSDVMKRLRRYQGKRFGDGSAVGRFQFSVWPGMAGPCLVVDRTKSAISLLPGTAPTNPFWTAIMADKRISSDAPGFGQRA